METDNKEKLTLKELAGYLPYKVPARLSRTGIFNLDSEYPNENAHKWGYIDNFYFNDGEISGSIRISENYSFDFEEEDFEIGLRPLSDLTKSITHNGETFVPIVELAKISGNTGMNLEFIDKSFYFTEDTLISEYGANSYVEKQYSSDYQFEMFQKLYEWHFDIHGLIEKGLAIDKNTLPNE